MARNDASFDVEQTRRETPGAGMGQDPKFEW